MTDSASASGLRRPGGRTARTRARVLDAVTSLLVEAGFDGLSIDAVAERSGVHRATVYRRWRDVGGLLADVFDAAAGDDWAPADTGSLVGDLVALNREVFASLREWSSVTRALIAASFRSAPAAAALQAFWRDRYRRCEVVVSRARARGEIAGPVDAQRLLVAATAPLYHRLVLMGESPREELAEQAARDAACSVSPFLTASGHQARPTV
ncbi:TetR/AcrR family transcriptional regulator [Amycolatopsis thermalba]|uniref:TetR/AcrR family transcriptional regulator n=1 Tax=Amycolatopsis thermalba TaxID=944492 RepID=A0ABY4NU94_9PSEU|nr:MULTISPECIES: TetR/AcrR family transcriptional regulator [Amycolatopsis]UQS23644.1 TetR/AcrR family transcriptional regulator [Amycolatopsis thermalba]